MLFISESAANLKRTFGHTPIGINKTEANGITIRESGFFGGDVQYVESVTGDLSMGGVFHRIHRRHRVMFWKIRLYSAQTA